MKKIYAIIALAAILFINSVQAAEQIEPIKTSYSFIEDASEKFMKRDVIGAIEELNRAVQSNPNNPELYLNRGYLKHVLGELDSAMTDYNYAIKINPNYAYAYNNRGVLKVALDDIDGALSDYEKAMNLKKNYSDVYYNRGNLKYMLGDNNGALADFDMAIQLNPKDADAYNNRGVVKKRMNFNVGALSDYSQAIALNPTDSIAYANRGHLKKLYFDNEGAAIDLNQAVALAENQVFIKNVKPLVSKENYITAIPVVNGITKTPVTARTTRLAVNTPKSELNFEKEVPYNQKKPINNVASTTKSLALDKSEAIQTAYKNTTLQQKNIKTGTNDKISSPLNAGVATVKVRGQEISKSNPMATPTTNTKLAESYYIRGLQKCILHDLKGAVYDLDKALANNSNYADAYFYRGAIKKELGDMEGFRADYAQAIKINPALQSFNASNAPILLQ